MQGCCCRLWGVHSTQQSSAAPYSPGTPLGGLTPRRPQEARRCLAWWWCHVPQRGVAVPLDAWTGHGAVEQESRDQLAPSRRWHGTGMGWHQGGRE